MKLRFVTRQVHAYLDYPVAISLMAMPIVLGVGVSNPLAKWLSIATGVAAFVLTVLTDHELGVIKVLPYWFHVDVDRVVGLTFVVAPFVLGFSGLDAVYYWANGAAVLTVTFLLNAPVAKKSPAKAAATPIVRQRGSAPLDHVAP